MHVSVLLQEVLEGLDPKSGEVVVDCTLGGGGHTEELLKRASGIKVIGLDADPEAIERVSKRLEQYISGHEKDHEKTDSQSTLQIYQSNFRHVGEVLDQHDIKQVDKVLMDLGLSSFQLDGSGRGFSFRFNEPLVMTFGKGDENSATDNKSSKSSEDSSKFTARDIVNDWEEENIADVIYAYGEETFARRIAKAIVEARKIMPIDTTDQLVEIIKQGVPRWYAFGKSNPATKTFQALRIAVNDELRALQEALDAIVDKLAPNGRLAVISFHSLEDRIVKQYFKKWVTEDKGKLLNKKPIVPTRKEVLENPRSRSSKLRIFQRNG